MTENIEHRIRELEDTLLAMYILLFSGIAVADVFNNGLLEATEKLVAEQRNLLGDLEEYGACRALDKLLDKLSSLRLEAGQTTTG